MHLGSWYFASPWYFLLLLLIPAAIVWYYLKGKNEHSAFRFPNFVFFASHSYSLREKIFWLPNLLRALAFIALVVALARPQSFSSGENVYTEGIDISLCVDISGSMLAEDFKPNRLEAAKKITQQFIDDRNGDRLGLVIFSRDAFTQCPMTIDYQVLKNLLKEIKSGMLDDGTAIGNAIANGINRLKDSKAKSKVLILLTDGVNNSGEVDPLTAAEIAKHYNVRIYTIGIGTIGQAPYPFQTPYGIQYMMTPVEIDETLLKQIASGTGGKYYRATGNQKLESIYKEIDQLEKSKVETTSYRSRKELFYPWAAAAGLLIMLELILSQTYLRRLP